MDQLNLKQLEEYIEKKTQERFNEFKTRIKFESDETNEIALALSLAQGEFVDVSANKKSYVGSYATFFDIVKSVRPALAKHKLAITQQVKWIDGVIIFSTKLRHESGQWIESQIPVLQKFLPINDSTKSPLQAFGMTIAYLERYSLKALLTIACEKD